MDSKWEEEAKAWRQRAEQAEAQLRAVELALSGAGITIAARVPTPPGPVVDPFQGQRS